MTDLHVGYERQGKKKRPVHNERAINTALEFIHDFQPDAVILGGDQLDLGCISHWNDSKHASTEDLSLEEDVSWLCRNVLDPLGNIPIKFWHNGNHERFAADLVEKKPALRDTLDIRKLCGLKERGWKFYDCGEVSKLGKLHFLHGENIRCSGNIAKSAVEMYRRSVRFGHHHRYEAYTLISPLDVSDVITGVAVPGLCNRGPKYGNQSPNRWSHGLLAGYIHPNGNYTDYIVIMVDGKFTWQGKTYGLQRTAA